VAQELKAHYPAGTSVCATPENCFILTPMRGQGVRPTIARFGWRLHATSRTATVRSREKMRSQASWQAKPPAPPLQTHDFP
jgi:hypothetical protein